ncbi:hypothetical protein FGB62_55g135 [Gracilaria domingensis]|nr:hypothetical protein FGB62_55g135 [Gracilaria domingensis]
MAFIISTSLPCRRNTTSKTTLRPRRTPFATAAAPQQQQPSNLFSNNASVKKPHKKASAHVVDSRVASRVEAHHWIVVKNTSLRIFERAAVAQADLAHQVDSRTHSGALHRWLLREAEDPTHLFVNPTVPGSDVRYVVMEAFDRQDNAVENQLVMRRWLSAVERVGRLMDAVQIQTLHYENAFTSKVHDVQFDPHHNIVVMESINVDITQDDAVDHVFDALRRSAERSVSAGECLEFCVLYAPNEHGFFKTIEVFKNVAALQSHMNGTDVSTVQEITPYLIQGNRNRQTFKPVMFT